MAVTALPAISRGLDLRKQAVDNGRSAWHIQLMAANEGDSSLVQRNLAGGEVARQAFFAKPIFHGARFDSHTLPVDVLPELVAFQEAVIQVAAALWRQDHPRRANLPAHFEAGFSLTIESIDRESGCVGVVLAMRTLLSTSPQIDLTPDEVPYAKYYENGRDQFALIAITGDLGSLPLNNRGKKALSKVGASLAADEYILLGGKPDSRDGAKIKNNFGYRFAEAEAIVWPTIAQVKVEGFFDSRSSRSHTLGIIANSHTITCQVNEGDVSQWNPFLDHRVIVYGLGEVNDSGEVLSVTRTDKVVLAEPAHLRIQFDRLRSLETGWRNPDSQPLDRPMLERLAVLLEAYESKGLPRPSLYPTEDGEARAEWSHFPWELSITASPNNPVFNLEALNLSTDDWIENEYDTSQTDDLFSFLRPRLGVPNANR